MVIWLWDKAASLLYGPGQRPNNSHAAEKSVLVDGVYALRWSYIKAPPKLLERMLVSLLGPACNTVQSVYPNSKGDI